MLIRKRLNCKVSNRCIRRWLKKTNITDAYTATVKELKAKLDVAFQQNKEAKKHASTLQEDFFEELAAGRAQQNGTTKEKELEQLKKIERKKQEVLDEKAKIYLNVVAACIPIF